MNKLYISIIALATLSGAAYANDRGYDLRDSDTCMGKYCNNVEKPFDSSSRDGDFTTRRGRKCSRIDQFRAPDEDL